MTNCIFDEWVCKNCAFGRLLNASDYKRLRENWGCGSEEYKKQCSDTGNPRDIYGNEVTNE